MATRIKAAEGDLYERDFYAWAERQAELLRAGRLADLDLDNLLLEVEGLADSRRSAVLNNARIVLEHLLKLEHSPARDPRNEWRRSVREHRRRQQTDLTPRLERILQSELPQQYAMTRADAAGSMRDYGEDAAADGLPETCPYDLERITGDWLP
jgi:hypothetical protein